MPKRATVKILATLAVGIVAFGLESCSFLPWFKEKEPQVVEPALFPTQEEDAVVETQPAEELGTGLIPPTNPSSQRKVIVQGRPDPFDPIAMQPIVTVIPPEPGAREPEPSNLAPRGASAQLPSTTSSAEPANRPAAIAPSAQPPNRPTAPSAKPANRPAATTPSATASETPPSATSPTATASETPAPPSATSPDPKTTPPPNPAQLAENIVITGVVEIGGVTHVILKAPNEPSSRYVQPGQYVAMGQVLVKDIQRSATPAVLLEQNGVEVLKSVGETAKISYDESASS